MPEKTRELWDLAPLARDFLVNLAAGIPIFIVGLRWRIVSSFLSQERKRFRHMFGARAYETGKITVTLDTYRDARLLPPQVQQQLGLPQTITPGPINRFFKIFPNHITAFPGAYEDVLGYCSARGASYLSDAFASIGAARINVRVVSDSDVASVWEGTFINLGSSASNIKTNDIKLMPENTWWLEDIRGAIELKTGRSFGIDGAGDKGIILKMGNPHSADHVLLVCAGLGEWGTSGAAWYLATHWKMLSRRFGKSPFVIIVNVVPHNDESAREVHALGEERASWRMRLWLRKMFRGAGIS